MLDAVSVSVSVSLWCWTLCQFFSFWGWTVCISFWVSFSLVLDALCLFLGLFLVLDSLLQFLGLFLSGCSGSVFLWCWTLCISFSGSVLFHVSFCFSILLSHQSNPPAPINSQETSKLVFYIFNHLALSKSGMSGFWSPIFRMVTPLEYCDLGLNHNSYFPLGLWLVLNI